MKQTGRNDPCPCGSGKKYKRCCMDDMAKQRAEVLDDIEHVLAMNPNLTLDEINAVAARHMEKRNSQPIDDFCGLSANQMQNWLYAPFSALKGVRISTPTDFCGSPVMRYLEIIIEEAMSNNGRFKATSKGNLPTKLVNAASALRPELSTSDYPTNVSISESRFIARCLEFWGFVKADPKRYVDFDKTPRNVKLQPLFEQAFRFEV